jgi:GT2 family glycosyltransferase
MISVVTVNYKTIEYTIQMLESLFTHHVKGALEVFVVENGSGDDLTTLRERFPQVQVIVSERNLGFAGGSNLGIKASRGEYVVLVNPDVIFVDEALYMMRTKMDQNEQVGIGGASLKNLDGTQQDCVWSFPTPTDQLLLLLKLNRIFVQTPSLKRWLMKGFNYGESADVDQVMGALFFIRRAVIDQIGLLDDGFFLWYEEVDFSKRAKNAGWRTRYFHDVVVKHKKGASFDQVATIEKQKHLRRSINRYMGKHHSKLAHRIFTLGEPIFILTSRIAALIKPM